MLGDKYQAEIIYSRDNMDMCELHKPGETIVIKRKYFHDVEDGKARIESVEKLENYRGWRYGFCMCVEAAYQAVLNHGEVELEGTCEYCEKGMRIKASFDGSDF
jgi:hypothetical protein